jgi:hypothetical protein
MNYDTQSRDSFAVLVDLTLIDDRNHSAISGEEQASISPVLGRN